MEELKLIEWRSSFYIRRALVVKKWGTTLHPHVDGLHHSPLFFFLHRYPPSSVCGPPGTCMSRSRFIITSSSTNWTQFSLPLSLSLSHFGSLWHDHHRACIISTTMVYESLSDTLSLSLSLCHLSVLYPSLSTMALSPLQPGTLVLALQTHNP